MDELIIKFLRGNLSEEEKNILDEWINRSPRHRKLLEELTDRDNLQRELLLFKQVETGEKGNAWKKAEALVFPGGAVVKRMFFNWRKMTVAAAVIMVVATFSYLLLSRSEEKGLVKTETLQSKYGGDAEPGTDGAILTLANGQTILLDSAANGRLAEQAGTEVRKDGSVVTYSGDNKSAEVLYNTLSTVRGRQFRLSLPDGSQVWLNSSSSIRFPTTFAGKDRRVEITGEAFFDVAKNTAQPFIVTVRGMEVEVLGTEFNINGYREEPVINTTLVEGSILARKGTNSVTIKPGQQAVLIGDTRLIIHDNADVITATAWKNGKIAFDNTDIKTLLRQISRWYDVDIVYKTEVKTPGLGGSILRTNNKLSEVLEALSINTNLKFEISGKTVFVSQ